MSDDIIFIIILHSVLGPELVSLNIKDKLFLL